MNEHAPDELTEQGELLAGGFSYLVTQAQLGEVLDLGHSMIAKLRTEGMPQVRFGVYDLRQCVAWYIDKWRRVKGASSSEETSTRAALNIAQRERIELEIRTTRAELLERDAVQATVAQLGTIVSSAFAGLGARCSDDLAAMTEAPAVRAYLRKEGRDTLAQMATATRELAAGLDSVLAPASEELAADPSTPDAPKRRTRKRAAA